ncbi:MAG: hypothetical protein AAGC93_28990, partial [Cyanobacteria bacterium P01_F01_bin.53]
LFHLFFQIIEADYFKNLGFSQVYYDTSTEQFLQKNIKRAIKDIAEKNREKYFRLQPNVNSLNFSNLPAFAKSYLLMIRDLDMTKRD